jgi:hypothetical protein
MFVCFSACAADDLADAKAAFTNLITYQKTDDIRSLDLFAKHCIITFRIVDGTNERLAVIPPAVFRESLKKEIAQKKGSDGDYEDVKFSSDGFMVKVNATIHYTDSGKKGPFFALYGRDKDGVMKIEEFRVTIFSHEHAH